VTVKDSIPPVITCPPPLAVNCANAVPAPATNKATFTAAGGTVTDDCILTPSVTFVKDSISNQVCANQYTINRIYQAKDTCGNTSTCIQTITVNLPTFTVPANGSSTVNCPALAIPPTTPAVTDACGTAITPTLTSTVDNPSPLTCNGTRVYTYTYTDCAGQ